MQQLPLLWWQIEDGHGNYYHRDQLDSLFLFGLDRQ